MIGVDEMEDIRKRARGGESIASIARAVGASVLMCNKNRSERTPDVFPDYSGYAAPASSSRACRIVLHPSAFLSFPPRYHSM